MGSPIMKRLIGVALVATALVAIPGGAAVADGHLSAACAEANDAKFDDNYVFSGELVAGSFLTGFAVGEQLTVSLTGDPGTGIGLIVGLAPFAVVNDISTPFSISYTFEGPPGDGLLALWGADNPVDWTVECDLPGLTPTLESVLSDIEALIQADAGSEQVDKLQDVADKLTTALDELDKGPADVEAAVGAIEGALGDLEAAIDNSMITPETGADLALGMLGIAQGLAMDAINAAAGGDADKLNEAQAYLDTGDDLRDQAEYKDSAASYIRTQ